MITRAAILLQAAEVGLTETQIKALTSPQKIALLQAVASSINAAAQVAGQAAAAETQRIYRKRMIVGGAAALPGETA